MTIMQIQYHLVLPDLLTEDANDGYPNGRITKEGEYHSPATCFIDLGDNCGIENIMDLIKEKILQTESANKISVYTGNKLDFSKATLIYLYCTVINEEQDK